MAASKTTIENVAVFDGHQLRYGQTVAFADGVIVADATGARTVVNGEGFYLLPGLIDCHVHVHDADDLALLARHGITTCLDMGTGNLAGLRALSASAGTCDIRSSGIPAIPHGSRLASRPGFPRRLLVTNADDAAGFVDDRLADGADYIKIMIELEGPDVAIVHALAAAARTCGRTSIAHTRSGAAVAKAVVGGVDVITHIPEDEILSDATLAQMQARSLVTVPTLVKTLLTTEQVPGAAPYTHLKGSVAKLHAAGVAILAGTDANKHATGISVTYGDSLWRELALLVDVGMSPAQALRAATSDAAMHFGLDDRGVIAPGRRADLVLLSANPVVDIANIKAVQRVWSNGIEVTQRAF
ncbi:hypothetical protein SEUCBS139899_008247 [Sporothrix eucalyptigena]|uniref:Amidohydrolase-related domain-containing protein n=1 Tax=Sporothrix eucalyptigena TaxID=1812306 RepID=A0ABP0CGS2_9PEZI